MKNSCVNFVVTGGRPREGRAEEAVEREEEEPSHASRQYIRLWKHVIQRDHVRIYLPTAASKKAVFFENGRRKGRFKRMLVA